MPAAAQAKHGASASVTLPFDDTGPAPNLQGQYQSQGGGRGGGGLFGWGSNFMRRMVEKTKVRKLFPKENFAFLKLQIRN